MVFKWAILKYNLMTVGREDSDMVPSATTADLITPTVQPVVNRNTDASTAENMITALGGKENIISLDNCVTRLRLTIKDIEAIDEAAIKSREGSQLSNSIKIPYRSLLVQKSSPCVKIWINAWGYVDGYF